MGFDTPGTTEHQKIWTMTEMCGGIESGEYLTKARLWESGGVAVYDTAYVYGRATGAEVVEKFRAKAASCDSYRGGNGSDFTVYPDLPLERPAGLSAFYALCEQTDGDGFLCSAVLARDNVVVKITVAGHGERSYFVDALGVVTGIAAAPLLTV